MLCLRTLKTNKDLNKLQFLISGETGAGKTELAKCFAAISEAKFIKVVSPEQLLRLSFAEQSNFLDKTFADARLSELSVIILDDLESLLQADVHLRDCSNQLRLKFQSLLKKSDDSKNKCIVIATTKSEKFIKEMGLLNLFQEKSSLKNIVLAYSDSNDIDTLCKFAELLGFKSTKTSSHLAADKRIIDLPISELLYKIKKFCTNAEPDHIFNLDSFYEFLTAKPKLLNESKLKPDTKKELPALSLLFGEPSSMIATRSKNDVNLTVIPEGDEKTSIANKK